AIAYAELIPSGNPRYQEVRQKIQAWILEVQRVEDRAILDQAQDIVRGGTVVALQEAITKASLITFNRTLYDEAQRNIHQWRASIQRQEDQPILEQAIFLGNSKNYNGAIQAARQIGRGRVLFREAQNKIRQWQQEIKAQKDFQEAYLMAQGGTSQALGSAIEVIRQIPGSTQLSNRSRQALNRWSYQLLSIAEDKARKDLFQEAIDLAQIIPAESTSYHGAQTQIRVWQRALNPPTPSTPYSVKKSPAPSKSAGPLTNDFVIETNH
ncbi:MAG: chromosome segregation ATPase, partial [cyanobacterium endosymbiont of Rhopalodia inflata]